MLEVYDISTAAGKWLFSNKDVASFLTTGQFAPVTIDSTNNIYLTGYFQGNYDFNTDTGSANIQMANSSIVGTGFVLKIKGNGNFSWAIYFDFIVTFRQLMLKS